MWVFPKAIVLTTKSHFHVKRTYASIQGLVVRTITSGKTQHLIACHLKVCVDVYADIISDCLPTLSQTHHNLTYITIYEIDMQHLSFICVSC